MNTDVSTLSLVEPTFISINLPMELAKKEWGPIQCSEQEKVKRKQNLHISTKQKVHEEASTLNKKLAKYGDNTGGNWCHEGRRRWGTRRAKEDYSKGG